VFLLTAIWYSLKEFAHKLLRNLASDHGPCLDFSVLMKMSAQYLGAKLNAAPYNGVSVSASYV
jgi:hypothetical protein